jgi:hypothetical protein
MPGQPASSTTHRPIFIAGTPGSGTTLLRLMLDSHENIAIAQETGFLRLAATHRWVPYWELGDQWAKNLGLSESEMWAQLGDFYGGLFASYAVRRGKQRWGDKTPLHVWHLGLAEQMYPELQVIGIVRHPTAVVASQRRRFRRGVGRASKQWKRSTMILLQQAAELGDRCVVLRYEDLVIAPEATMRPLLEWLGEPWSDRVLAHHEAQPSGGAAAEVEGFTRTDTPIDSSRVDTWQDLIRGPSLDKVVKRTEALAGFLGYNPMVGEPTQPWAPDAPYLTGTQVRERQHSGSGIDWAKRAKPPVADRPMRPPAPKRGRHKKGLTLDEVTLGALVRHKLIGLAHRRLPDNVRHRANNLRRKSAKVDRLIGPR